MKRGLWMAAGLTLLAAMGVALLLRAPAAEAQPATVVEAVNQVDAHPRPKDAWQPARVGMKLFGGGQLRTGADSWASLELPEGRVRLAADCVFTVKESATRQGKLWTTLDLEKGRLWINLTTDQPHEFAVQTNGAIAAVRDTRFSVAAFDGATRVSVAEGSVTLTAQGRMVTVKAGEQSTAVDGQMPSLPEPMSDDERTQWATEGQMPKMAPSTPTPTVTPVPITPPIIPPTPGGSTTHPLVPTPPITQDPTADPIVTATATRASTVTHTPSATPSQIRIEGP
ncbi:MAG: FecR family protein [Chloroflexota bacterium]